MNANLLLAPRYKKIGLWLLLPALAAGLYLQLTGAEPAWLNLKMLALVSFPLRIGHTAAVSEGGHFFRLVDDNISNELVGILIICSALMVGFSREAEEDEYIGKLRLQALLWAVLVNYGLLLFCFLFIFSFEFYTVMVYNMFTVLFLFIGRFHYLLYRQSRALNNAQ